MINDNRLIKSSEEFRAYLKSLIDKKIAVKRIELASKGQSSRDADKLNANDLVDIISNNIKLLVKPGKVGDYKAGSLGILYIENYFDLSKNEKGLYNVVPGIYMEFDVEDFVQNCISYCNVGNRSIDRFIKDVDFSLRGVSCKNENKFELFNPAPSNFVLFTNGVFDIKERRMLEGFSVLQEYHFTSFIPFNLKPEQDTNSLLYQIVTRLIRDWGDGNSKRELLIKQLAVSAIEGDGRGKYVFLKGDGGNGKSTYLYILLNLVGEQFTRELDLHDLYDDNKLGDIENTTKLIRGNDLGTNHKLGNSMISRFKTFCLGEPIKLNVKYKPTRVLENKGLKIQNTNTDIDFFENSTAVKRRVLVLSWTNADFSKKIIENEDLNLDNLVYFRSQYSKDFYEAFLSLIIFKTEPFKTFVKVEEDINYTNDMIDSADIVNSYLTYLDDMDAFCFEELPINALIKGFQIWHKETVGLKPLADRNIKKRLLDLLPNYGYEWNKGRSYVSQLDFDENIFKLTYPYKAKYEPLRRNTAIGYVELKNKNSNLSIDKVRVQDLLLKSDVTINDFTIKELVWFKENARLQNAFINSDQDLNDMDALLELYITGIIPL